MFLPELIPPLAPAGAQAWRGHILRALGLAEQPLINEKCKNSTVKIVSTQHGNELSSGARWPWQLGVVGLESEISSPLKGDFLWLGSLLVPFWGLSCSFPWFPITSWECNQWGKWNTFPSRDSLKMPPQISAALQGPEQNSGLFNPSHIKPDWNQVVLSIPACGCCSPMGLRSGLAVHMSIPWDV